MLQDAVLHLVQPEVVVVEPLLGMVQVQIVFRIAFPRQVEHQLQVVELHGILGYGRIHPLQLRELLEKQLLRLGFPTLFGSPLVQLVDVLVGRIAAQLVLNRAYLLLQEILALLLVDVLLDLALYLVLQLGQLLLADQNLEQTSRAGQQARSLQQALAVAVGQIEIRADEIDDAALVVDVLDRERSFLGHLRRHVDDIQRDVLDRIDERLELDVVLIGRRILQRRYRRFEIGFRHDELADLDLFEPVQDDRQVTVRHFEHFQNTGGRADTIQVVRSGLLNLRLLLQHGAEDSPDALDLAHELHRLLAPDRNRRDRAREKHRAAKRQNRQYLGYIHFLGSFLVVVGHDRNHMVTAFEHIRYARKLLFFLAIFFIHLFLSFNRQI